MLPVRRAYEKSRPLRRSHHSWRNRQSIRRELGTGPPAVPRALRRPSFGETIPHRGHIAARMPNRVAARVQQADLNIWIVERTAASDRDRSFDAPPVFLEQ